MPTIGTYNYDLSKLLMKFLSDVWCSEYGIKDSFTSFIGNPRNDKYCMGSFNIISLLSNKPMDETFEIILVKFFSSSVTYKGFTRAKFKKRLDLCAKII